MFLHEEKINLMNVPQGYMIAHCISADFALGAGVAKQIDDAYNMREMLNLMWGKISGMRDRWSTPACLPVANVFNLVTKERYFHKPTYEDLDAALREMKNYAVEMGVKRIAMPRIGCGLDRLNWDEVMKMLHEMFIDTDIEIMVCVL